MLHLAPRSKLVRSAIFCLLMIVQVPCLSDSAASLVAQAKEDSETTRQQRLEVTDSDDGKPIADAEISITYWIQKKRTVMKRELELKTNAEGIAELPKIQAEKTVITVTAAGYRAYSRWLKMGGDGNARIQLEKRRPPK